MCKTSDCKNLPHLDVYCSTCASRRYRKKYPIKYAYDTLKHNAKRRQKDFSLTLEEFSQFCEDNNYLELVGRHANDVNIDRIDETLGYHIDNIQVLTNVSNIKKYLKWTSRDENNVPQFKYVKVIMSSELDEDACPF